MPNFSLESLDKLKTCNPELIRLFNIVIKYYDCTVVSGFRDRALQEKLFAEGRTKLHFPNSKHNHYLSRAIDVVPYPIDYSRLDKLDRLEWCRMYHFVGFVLATAESMGIKVRSGGDWDGDLNIRDQNFYDLPHWELVE